MSGSTSKAALRRRKSQMKGKGADDNKTGQAGGDTSTSSSSKDRSSGSDKKPPRDTRDMSKGDRGKEIDNANDNISKSTLLLPKDASLLTKVMYVLREALLRMDGQDRGDDDGGDDKKKSDSDAGKDSTKDSSKDSDQSSERKGTPQENRDLKKAMDKYRQATGDLMDKIDKLPKVANLPTDPADIDKADIEAGVGDINRDINKARYFPPGIAGVFLKIAYLLREALLKMDGQGTEEGKSYKKLLEEYKEAYAEVKHLMDREPGAAGEDESGDGVMTKEEVKTELDDIKNRFSRIAQLPDSDARALLEGTLNEVQGMLDEL